MKKIIALMIAVALTLTSLPGGTTETHAAETETIIVKNKTELNKALQQEGPAKIILKTNKKS